MDAEEMKRVTEELQRLNTAVEAIAEKAGANINSVAQNIRRTQQELGDEMVTVNESIAQRMGRSFSRMFKNTRKDAEKEGEEAGNTYAKAVGKGLKKIQSFIPGLQSFALGKSPMGQVAGGLFGLMLFGRMKEAEYVASANKIAQVSQRAGRGFQDLARDLTKDVRKLELTIPGIAQEFEAANAAFAQMGFGEDEVTKKGLTNFEGMSNNLLVTAAALAAEFDTSAGEIGKIAASIAVDTNVSLKEALKLTKQIGEASRATGVSFGAMTQAVMQTTSALRLQGIESKDVADAILKAQTGFRASGMSMQRAGQLAQSGVQGIGAVIAGMDVGLKAEIGRALGAGGGLAGVRKLETDLSGDGAGFSEALQAIIKLSSKIAEGDSDKQFFVLKQLFGMNAEQAETLLNIQKTADDGLSLDAAIKANSSDLTKSFKDEALKQNKFTEMMNRLIDIVARLGSELLNIVVAASESLIAGFLYLGDLLTVGVTKGQTAAFKSVVQNSIDRMSASGGRMVTLGTRAKNLGLDALGVLAGEDTNAKGLEKLLRETANPKGPKKLLIDHVLDANPEDLKSMGSTVLDALSYVPGPAQPIISAGRMIMKFTDQETEYVGKMTMTPVNKPAQKGEENNDMPISNTPLAQTFQALVGQAQAVGHGDGMRVPFQFSSTLREKGAANELPKTVIDPFFPQGTLPVVSTLINPSSIQWTQAKRIQRQDVRNGTVFTHFMNTAGQDIDILELTLSGTTGNIDLREETFAAFATQPVAARRKLQVWHNLYALTREPRLIPPNIVNKQTIRMQTKLFPGGIRLSGFYSSVLQFTESADTPNSVDWTMNFTVQDTTPNLNDIMRETFKQLSSGEALQPQRGDTSAEGETA